MSIPKTNIGNFLYCNLCDVSLAHSKSNQVPTKDGVFFICRDCFNGIIGKEAAE